MPLYNGQELLDEIKRFDNDNTVYFLTSSDLRTFAGLPEYEHVIEFRQSSPNGKVSPQNWPDFIGLADTAIKNLDTAREEKEKMGREDVHSYTREVNEKAYVEEVLSKQLDEGDNEYQGNADASTGPSWCEKIFCCASRRVTVHPQEEALPPKDDGVEDLPRRKPSFAERFEMANLPGLGNPGAAIGGN